MGSKRQTSIRTSKNRLHIPSIAISIAKWAYLKEKRCCSGNCIFTLVEKYTLDKVALAVHLARSDTYHTNANRAHEELRELLKFGRCPDTGEVVTYFDHKNVFTSEPAKIKVSFFSVSVDEDVTYISCNSTLILTLGINNV